MCFSCSVSENHVIPGGAGADPCHAYAAELLDELDVGTRLRRQLAVGLDVRRRRLPALEFAVDDLAFLEQREVRGEVLDLLAVRGLVGDCDLERREGIEDVELRQVEALCVYRLALSPSKRFH